MKNPHGLTPFYKMPSFWLMFVLPIIIAIGMLIHNPAFLLS